MYSHEANVNFGHDAYEYAVKYKTAVVSVGKLCGDPVIPHRKVGPFYQMLNFFGLGSSGRRGAEPGDYVYVNGSYGNSNSNNRITHRGKYTGRVFTADLTHPAILHLMRNGCRFEEGVIGKAIHHYDRPETCAPIYIELYDFEELKVRIKGPGRPGHMLYKVYRGPASYQNFLNTYA